MPPDSEVERRLVELKEKVDGAIRRIDELYQLVGQLAVHEAVHEAKTEPPVSSSSRWREQVPVKWIVIWACGIVTLGLATAGFIDPTLLESLWKFLAGAFGTG